MSVKANWANGEQFTAADANAVAEGVNNAYVKPGTGIPKTDLASAVQTSLGLADSAVQSVSSTSITDATTTGRALITTTDASTARTTLGVAYGTTSGTVCQGNDSRLSPTSNSLTDATATGKALITAVDASAARTTLGTAYGNTATTVCVGNDSRLSDARTPTAHSHVVSDITASTSLPLGVGSLEVGHATDTTVARSAAGQITVEGKAVLTEDNTVTVSGKTLTNPTVTNYVESVVANGTKTTSHTFDLTSGTVQTVTLTASTACTFTMPTATAGKSFIVLLKQAAATGNGTATFTGVKWSGGTAPTITATAAKMDILSFVSDGTNWYGSFTQNYTP